MVPYSSSVEEPWSVYGDDLSFEQTNAVLQIFETLQKNIDPKVLENKARAAEERERQHYESAQRRFADLVSS